MQQPHADLYVNLYVQFNSVEFIAVLCNLSKEDRKKKLSLHLSQPCKLLTGVALADKTTF